MPPWWIKAGVQRGLGLLPNAPLWNELFQQHVARSLVMDDTGFDFQLAKCRQHLGYYQSHAPKNPAAPRQVLELGTGWHGIFPMAMFLAGADTIWTWDIAPLLKPHRIRAVIDHFLRRAASGRLAALFPEALPERLERLARYPDLPELGIHVKVGDARTTGLPSGTIDLISSTVVLEYIPRPIVVQLFREFHRVGAAGAVMTHEIDMMDQYAFFDPSITRYHFLKFSDRAWRWINNPLIPLNRLRVSDYRECLAETGFQLVEEKAARGTPAELARVPLAPRFAAYATDDLLVVDAWLVARPLISAT